MQHITFIIEYIIRISIGTILNIIFTRQKNIVLFGQQLKLLSNKNDIFAHNSKYLFLHLCNNYRGKYLGIWLCDDKKMRKILHNRGYKNVFSRKSIKGIYYTLKAKFICFDMGKRDVNTPIFMNKSIKINFWHGTSWKKIGNDANLDSSFNKLNKFQKIIYKITVSPADFFITNNEYEIQCYQSAFLVNKNQLPILCSPRLDVLFKDIKDADIFMEKDFNYIKKLKEDGKFLFIYMPTYRDTGKDISGWLKSENTKSFLQKNNAVLICKLHQLDANSLDFDLGNEFYKMDNHSDIYPILKYTDALITDYSSIALDYLLLNKPIIYYPLDLKEYQEQCRGFYVQYDEFVAGDKAYNESELIKAMQSARNGVDNYYERRKELREKMFKYQDGKNCERVIEWIKTL